MSIYKKTTVAELKLSIESMLNQTIKPEQFIIVCDGPINQELDNTLNFYDKLNQGLFTIVRLKTNSGLAVALNSGISEARNELVARMDSDDISLPSRCEKQLKAFDLDKELTLLGTPTLDFSDDPNNAKPSVSSYPINHEDIKQTLRRNDPFAHSTMMYRKSAVIACGGYDPELRRRQDYDLFSKMVNMGYKSANLSEPLLLYKVDSNNFERIKSKESCKSRILVQKRIYKRRECSFIDFAYIFVAMTVSRIMPLWLYKAIYKVIKQNDKRRAEINN